jgi:hypothetical protein
MWLAAARDSHAMEVTVAVVEAQELDNKVQWMLPQHGHSTT